MFQDTPDCFIPSRLLFKKVRQVEKKCADAQTGSSLKEWY